VLRYIYMSDETTDESNAEGKEANKPVTDDKKDISELDKLKASNDAFEKELIRGRELKAEAQKLEAEKMLGGKTEAGTVAITPEEELQKKAEERAKEIVDAFK